MKAPMYETVPAAEPTLAETCAVLKRELGLSGSITEVISGACRALGVDDTGTIVARAKKCREVLGLGTGGDVAAGAALAGTVVEAAPAGTFVGAEAGPTIVGVAAPAVAGTVIGFVAPTAQPIEPFAAPAASGRTHHFQYVRGNRFDGAGLVQCLPRNAVAVDFSPDAANSYARSTKHRVGDVAGATRLILAAAGDFGGDHATMWSKGAPGAWFSATARRRRGRPARRAPRRSAS